MTTLKTITIEFSKDLYEMEVCQASSGKLFYYISINGTFSKGYQRLSKELRKFFKLEK